MRARTMSESPLSPSPTSMSHSLHPQPPECSTFGHELRDDVDGLLGDHCIQLHQLIMPQSLHQVGLRQEGLHRHAPWLHHLHGYLGVLVVGGWSQRGNRKGGQSPLLFPHSSGRPSCKLAPSRKPAYPRERLWPQKDEGLKAGSPCPSWVSLGKSLNLSELWFPHLPSGNGQHCL